MFEDYDRYFHEVLAEEMMMDDLNGELQILADAERESENEAAYSEFLQEMFRECYEEIDAGCEVA